MISITVKTAARISPPVAIKDCITGGVIQESSPQSCVKVQPHQKHNVLRCEPNCHAFLSEERGQEQ